MEKIVYESTSLSSDGNYGSLPSRLFDILHKNTNVPGYRSQV